MADSRRPQVLEHLGPYVHHSPVAAFGSLSDRAYDFYKDAVGGDERRNELPTEHLVTRMIYIAETTSIGIRLNASWAISHPALSLLRDRYEQTVRFSWLARQSTNSELVKYVASYYAKANSLYQQMSEMERNELRKMPFKIDEWMTEKPSKQQREYLKRWSSVDLRTLAQRRDALAPIADCEIEKETLASLYTPVYAQFSSVTHYDMYSMNILGLQRAPNGQLVLAPDPHFPSIINLHNSLFDLIQCFEAASSFWRKDCVAAFDPLIEEWRECVDRVIGAP